LSKAKEILAQLSQYGQFTQDVLLAFVERFEIRGNA